MKLCLSRKIVRADAVVQWARYTKLVHTAAREFAERPSRIMITATEKVLKLTGEIVLDYTNSIWSASGLRKLEPQVTKPPELNSTPELPVFGPDEKLESGFMAVLGCIACTSGTEPSPAICPLDAGAVRAKYEAGELGE